MITPEDEQTLRQIAADLDRCEILQTLGTKSQKASARKHRRECFRWIHESNTRDGLDTLTDEELLRELSS